MDSTQSDESTSIEDLYTDPEPLTDPLSQFLSMRYRKREAFRRNLNQADQVLVQTELQRIEYFRNSIQERKLSPSDTEPLIFHLEQARKIWNEEAYRHCSAEISNMKGWASEKARRNRLISRQVQARQGLVANEPESLSRGQRVETNMTRAGYDRNYGINGWHLSLKRGKGGIGDGRYDGKFQKMPIQQLLHGEDSPLRRGEADVLRYIHLPANNMEWVERAISRYYDEERTDFGGHGVLNARSKTQRLLKDELWRGQQRGGLGSPAHARQIGARCSVVPAAPNGVSGTDIALFMPYLHWEVEKRLMRMSNTVQEQTTAKQPEGELRRHRARCRTKLAELAKDRRIQLERLLPGCGPKAGQWRPTSALARYMWFAAKMFEVIDEMADERLVKENINSKAPIHLRRTLDQFYHWTMTDTTAQDHNQVVCRKTRSGINPRATSRLIMVDQLWMWILDENTILTCFPRRLGRNKPDPSAVHRGIRQTIAGLDKHEALCIYDLALVIIDECSRVFFDRTAPLDQRPEVVAIFGSAISDVAEQKTMAYEAFGQAIKDINKPGSVHSDHEDLLRKSLNINFEWSVLIEAQHLIDELQIMQEVFTQQLAVARDVEKATECNARCGSPVRDRAKELVNDMETRREELAGLERLATKIRLQLRELLDMKQQQAGIIEAKAAIKRADVSVLQGRSIIVFTVFTIFFLPLSFFASVFGMNAAELNGGAMPLAKQLMYMFSLSGALILFSLSVAFSAWVRTIIAVPSGLAVSYLGHWMGLHHVVTNNIKKLRGFEMEKKRLLEDRSLDKMLAKIKQREAGGETSGHGGDSRPAASRVQSRNFAPNGNMV